MCFRPAVFRTGFGAFCSDAVPQWKTTAPERLGAGYGRILPAARAYPHVTRHAPQEYPTPKPTIITWWPGRIFPAST